METIKSSGEVTKERMKTETGEMVTNLILERRKERGSASSRFLSRVAEQIPEPLTEIWHGEREQGEGSKG